MGYCSCSALCTDELTVFVNDLDAFRLTVGRITKVSGLKSFIPAWEIQDSGSERSFVLMAGCGAPVRSMAKEILETGVRFEQQCIGEASLYKYDFG